MKNGVGFRRSRHKFLLDHVSFQVPKGRIVGFIGENGTGKSTTIKLILDELKKDNVLSTGLQMSVWSVLSVTKKR